MDEFVYVLIAVAIIFALLFAFSTPLAEIMNDEGLGAGGMNTAEVANLSGGSVGMVGNNIAKVVNFGTFELGRPQEYSIIEVDELDVKSGLTESNSGRFDVDTGQNEISSTMKGLKISFDLKKTNQLGNLVIKWNGYEVFNDIANLNHYEIDIPTERIMETNDIEVSCRGPGWMFWAVNHYDLRNFRVYAEYGPERIVPFELSIEELETWDKGEFKFFITGDDDTDLLIKLNGDIIYSGDEVGERILFDVNYTSADLRPGTNLMAFRADGGIITLHNTKMNVVTFGSKGATIEKTLNVTRDKYAYLSRFGAYFDINIKSMDKTGTLKIEINGKTVNVPVSSTGKTTIMVDSSKFRLGENHIKLSGNGAWEIENIRIYSKR